MYHSTHSKGYLWSGVDLGIIRGGGGFSKKFRKIF